MVKPWKWVKKLGVRRKWDWALYDGRGRCRAEILANSEGTWTWWTWAERGAGGENNVCATFSDAFDQAVTAVVRQGWTPWKLEMPMKAASN